MDGYDVVVCADCGFCFADHIPPQPIFDVYYREMSKYEIQNDLGQVSKYDFERLSLIASHLMKFIPKPDSQILEIGCSTGTLLSILKNNGFSNVVGADPSPACAQAADRLYGIKVFPNALSDMVIEDESIEVMILVGVLEHIRDLDVVLQKCWKMLAHQGLLYIVVPDASRYFEGDDAPFQEFSVEHINFFGPDSLSNLMVRNGYSRFAVQQGMVIANYRTTTPVIYGVYQKKQPANQPAILPDKNTEQGLKQYIEQSMIIDQQIKDKIAHLVASHKPIIVWGTGAHTLRLLNSSDLRTAEIRAFVDTNPKYHGKKLNGVQIVSPEALKAWTDPILISSRNYQEEIAKQIREELSINNPIVRLYP
ncbi:MAG TPA: class I SAM-dependent methyltransferase [Anaerolineaceae bacterium]